MLDINKIYQGNCLELMKDIPEKSIDMILCDLPYGTTACKWDTIIPFEPLWEQYKRIIKEHGTIVLTGAEPFSSYLRMSNIKWYKYDYIWCKSRKTGFQNSKIMPMREHETISVFYFKQPIFNQELVKLEKPISSWRKNGKGGSLLSGVNSYTKDRQQEFTGYKTSLIKINNEHNVNKHPTQKPVALFEYLIRTYTNEGMLVLDNCIGSGTTAVACINTNRNYIGIEQSKEYCDVAEKRIQEAILKSLLGEV